MANAALDTGGAVGANYDAAMRLVEISANPEMLKGKLEELRKQEFAAKAEMDKLAQEQADFKIAQQDLQTREGILVQNQKDLAEDEAAFSERKIALDLETAERNQAGETERQRLKGANIKLKREQDELRSWQGRVVADNDKAIELNAEGQALKSDYEGKIEALRAIVCG